MAPTLTREAAIRRHAVTVSGAAGAGRTFVLTHGFGCDQQAWVAVASDLDRDSRVFTYDCAGAGRSEPSAYVPHDYLSLRAYGRDLARLLEALDLRDVIAVGHSAGAMASALAAIERPDRVSKLVLIGASPHYLDKPGYAGGFTRQDVDDVYSAITDDFHHWTERFARRNMGNPDRPDLADHFVRSFRAMPPEHVLTTACAIFQSDLREDMAKIACPTLILQSRDDPAVPMAVARFLHEAIAGSRLTVVDATGHLPHVSAPEAVAQAIRDFLA